MPPRHDPWLRRVRRRLSWRRVLAGLALIMAVVLLAPTAVVDAVVTRTVSAFGSDCVALSGLDVDSGSWPVVARAVAGRLQDVSGEVDEVRFDAFAVHDVSFTVDEADVAPLGGGLVAREADVRGGAATGTLRFTEIERIIADHGVDATVRREGRRVVAEVDVPIVDSLSTGLTVAAADGGLDIRLAPLDQFTSPPLHITPSEPFRIEDVDVLDDGVQVDLAFDGELAAGDSHCTSVDEEG
jgi:hypothetical protein